MARLPALYSQDDLLFLTHMIVHHRQALELTAMVPTHSQREEFLRYSRYLEGAQSVEIDQMQGLLDSAAARGVEIPHHEMTGDPPMHGMLSKAQMAAIVAAKGKDFEQLWLKGMILPSRRRGRHGAHSAGKRIRQRPPLLRHRRARRRHAGRTASRDHQDEGVAQAMALTRVKRREALQLLGIGALATAASPMSAFGQTGPALTFPKGAVIRTLFKDYAPEELAGGATLFHEHLSLGTDFMERFRAASAAVLAAQGLPQPAGPSGPPPAPAGADPMRDVTLMADELRKAQKRRRFLHRRCGLEGAGADIKFIREAAKLSGLAVVKGAGFYTEPFYPKDLAKMSEEQITRALVRQCDEYPAGAFGEIGSWDEITATERKVFRAVGKAHVATNLPIFTHTGIPGKSALEQLDLLEDGWRCAWTCGDRAPGESQRSCFVCAQGALPTWRVRWVRSARQWARRSCCAARRCVDRGGVRGSHPDIGGRVSRVCAADYGVCAEASGGWGCPTKCFGRLLWIIRGGFWRWLGSL